MRRVLAAACFLSLLSSASYAQVRPITVGGCAIRGVQPYCIVLLAPGGRRYDISNAEPKPALNTYGIVTGNLHEHWFGPCNVPQAIAFPATWHYRGRLCPLAKRRHKG